MPLSIVSAIMLDAIATGPAVGVVRIVSGIMALVMVGVILFRRRNAPKKEEES